VSAGARAETSRNAAIDVLRGIVMILMTLDHVRDYVSHVRFSPTDLTRTTTALFFTRWVTHFCAPVFVFLAGTAAYLSLARGKTRGALSRFLWTRGLFLVFLELSVVRFAWTFNFDYQIVFVQVIWALGWSMIVLALLVRLPDHVTGAIGVAMIALHNLLDPLDLRHDGVLVGAGARDWILATLHEQRPPIIYPLVPWIGVMAAGFVFGKVFSWDADRRRRICMQLGLGAVVLFVLLRASGVYGEPMPWQGPTGSQPVLSFLNVTKYPPSLCFLLITLGPAIASLPLLERASGRVGRVLGAYGRAPLFYYLAHIFLTHAIAVGLGVAQGYRAGELCVAFFMLPDGYGFSLGVVYAVWAVVVIALYAPTACWADLKARNKQSVVLSYL